MKNRDTSYFDVRRQTLDARRNVLRLTSNVPRIFFITGTDTGVGKTVATAVLGVLLQERGYDVGVMKPVQCGGNDAQFLKKFLHLSDSLEEINPCFAKEPLSPHLAFARQKTAVDVEKIIEVFHKLKSRHDILLIEGVGGLLVPLKEGYFVLDLIKELNAEVIIVSRLGLGTINHTLLSINQVRSAGLKVQGIIFNTLKAGASGLAEKTNPEIVERLGNVAVLGTIPFFSNLSAINARQMIKRCAKTLLRNIHLRHSERSEACLSADRNLMHEILRRCAPQNDGKWTTWDKQYLWHPFTQMKDWLKDEPLVIEEAKGCYLKDTRGNWYLDGISSLWVNVHGHRKKEIDEALKDQVNKLSHSTFLGLSNVPAIELAKELVSIAPKGLEKVFYSDNGSTSVEVALKMAYQYWQNIGRKGKTKIVHLENSYHGDTLGSVSVGGIDLFHKVYRDLIFETISVESFELLTSAQLIESHNSESGGSTCLPAGRDTDHHNVSLLLEKSVEKLFRKKHEGIAALIVEPLVQGAAGMIVWPLGLLKKMAELCQRYNILLIADEVATGFGRTGKMFACDHEGVSPDFLCLAKGLTGGYLPLAATLTTQKIFEGFLFDYKDQKTFFHGHTYTGNPLACTAALANLRVFKKEQTIKKLQPKIKYLAKGLKKFYNLPSVGDVRQKGLMVGIELVKDRYTKEPYPWKEKIGVRVCQEIRKHGVILRPLGNVIVLMPPLVISIKELEVLLQVTYDAIRKVT